MTEDPLEQDQPFTREDVIEASPYSRRELMSVLAAGGVATVAGCSGGDQPTDTPTDSPTDRPTATTGRTTAAQGATPGEETTGDGETPADTATSAPTATRTPIPTTDIYQISGQDAVQVEQAQMNLWNEKTGYAPPGYANPPSMYATDHGLFLGYLSSSFQFTDDDSGITMGPWNVIEEKGDRGLKYHDDSKFQVEDFLNQQTHLYETFIQVANDTYDRSLFDYENLRKVDQITAALDFAQQGNPDINIHRALEKEAGNGMTDILKTNPDLHGQFVQRGKEASSASEKQSLIQDLLTYEIPIAEGVEKMGVQAGELRSFTKSMVVSEWREPYATRTYPWGFQNELNPYVSYWYKEEWGDRPRMAGTVQIPFVEDAEDVARNVVLNAALAGKIDNINDLRNPSIIDEFPPGWRLIPGNPEEATAVCFSPGGRLGAKTETARKRRQAIAYLLDPSQFSKIAKLPTPSHKVSGIPYAGIETRFLGTRGQYDNTYTNYGDAAKGWVQEEKGFELLRETGLEQDSNGQWIDSQSGEPFELRFAYYSGSAALSGAAHGENITEQLQQKGILVDGNNVSGGRMETLIGSQEGRKQWDLTLLNGQCQTIPHPYFGFRQDCGLGSKSLAPSSDWGPADFRNGYAQVEVPMPVGEPDGDLGTVNYDRMVRQLPKVTDTDKGREMVKELAWTINQFVPMVVMAMSPDPNAINMNKYESKIPLDHEAWQYQAHFTTSLVDIGALDVNPDYFPKVTPQKGTEKDF